MHQDVIDKLVFPKNPKILLGLDRVEKVLSLLGNPQNSYKVIHITGTNGKGSTATFIEYGLYKAGYKVGKFTSPYIRSINETIRLDLVDISNGDINRLCLKVIALMSKFGIELSSFELLTVTMFLYFHEKQIDYLILEVGMGGARDATNVIARPFCVIITNIALEHTNWFGNGLADIAEEKVGIIKGGCPVIIADSSEELFSAVTKKTHQVINVLTRYEVNTQLDFTNFNTQIDFIARNSQSELLQRQRYKISLFGRFQAYNFLCAYEVFKFLDLDEQAISYSASCATCSGRLEVLSLKSNTCVLLDATHNEAGAKVLSETLSENYTSDEIVIVCSILKDKNISAMLDYFTQLSNVIIFTSITNTDRGMCGEDLYKLAKKRYTKNPQLKLFFTNEPKNAVDQAIGLNKKVVLITGSLYLLQELGNKKHI